MPAARAVIPVTAHPDGARIWRITPMSAHPNPAAVPNPFAANPNVARAGRGDINFGLRRRRRLFHNDSAASRVRGTLSVYHEIHNAVAHTGAVQINDVRRTQAIHRVRAFDLADDDFVAHAGMRERLDVRE